MTDSHSAAAARIHPRAAFLHRNFRLYAGARFLGFIAWQMQSVAIGQQVYMLTHSPLLLGLIGLAQFIPNIAFVLVTGHTADRYDRRRIIMVCKLIGAACSVGLIIVSILGMPKLWVVFVLLALYGTAKAFETPAGQALMPNLVPTEHFSNAVTWNSSIMQVALIIGPASGGLIYAFGGPAAVYAVAAAAGLCALALTASINARSGGLGSKGTSWSTVVAGVRFVWMQKIILGATTLDLFAVLLGGAVALMPAFANDILKVGPLGLGVLRAAPAAGATFMALTLVHLPPMRRAGATMLWCVAGFGVATVVFGFSRNFYL